MAQLYIVPTPIGNLKDMTFRAVEVLQEVDLILAEDTRVSGKLLQHYSIDTPMKSHHQHNEHKTVSHIADRIQNGENIALISDAGTPAISDPGFLLTRECVQRGIKVNCLPGATAFVPALVNSGLPNNRFVFEGFLPPKKGRKKRIASLVEDERSIILYESPYKLLKTLQQIAEYAGGNRQVSVSRELTKVYEETINGSLAEVIEHFTNKLPKGEFVIVLSGKES
ncbi:MAG: 16S rRNA (cytidine(1402)-2'-O)-methyltransferase [Bacteroidota bacterium]